MTTIHNGDCIETMNQMPPESVDAIVTDPPYGLGFMGKKWDGLPPSLEWAEACYRVLKPGGHIVAFGGTRTWHRLAVAIEDAGFEMRDSLAWLYGSGFPKSHDVGKAIDKLDASEERTARAREFQSWLSHHMTPKRVNELTDTHMGHHLTTHPTQPAVATADLFDRLRPHLPEVPERIEELVRQRTVESQTFASRDVVGAGVSGKTYGMGGLRGVETSTGAFNVTAPATPEAEKWDGWGTALKPAFEPIVLARKPLAEKTVARNVLEHGTGAINIDATRIGPAEERSWTMGKGIWMFHGFSTLAELEAAAATGGECPDGRDAAATLARYRKVQDETVTTNTGRWPANVLLDQHAAAWVDEQSGASRFFYSAKAPKAERPNVDGVQHPTVKPLAIMRWLIRLVTPPGGTVLDPFAGSGTTIEAALIEGFEPVGIEMETDYLPLIQHRIDRQAAQLGI